MLTKKQMLYGYQDAKNKEREIIEELEELRLSQIYKSQVNDGMPHGNGGQGDLSGYAALIYDKEIELGQAREAAVEIKREIKRASRFLKPNERNIIMSKYIACRTDAETMRIYRIKRASYYKILKKAEEKIPLNGGVILGELRRLGCCDC